MRSLSGVQPSGKLHLGNYFGAVRQFLELQNEGEAFFFIADLHALTTVRDAETMRQLSLDVALDYLALGVDPQKAAMFRQSQIPEVTQLAWLLGSVMPKPWLDRAHSYKDKVARGIQPEVGLYYYPVLMAADILLYDSDVVPVGKDQKQHLEITQDLAARFNLTFCADQYDAETQTGGALKRPQERTVESTAVVPGTDGQKMSKSYENTIDLFGTDKQLKQQVMRVVTDSTPLEAPKDPDTCNVFALLTLVAPEDALSEIAAKYRAGGYGYGHAKLALLDHLHASFDEARARRKDFEQNLDFVHGVLQEGVDRARSVGTVVLDRAYRACGIR